MAPNEEDTHQAQCGLTILRSCLSAGTVKHSRRTTDHFRSYLSLERGDRQWELFFSMQQ